LPQNSPDLHTHYLLFHSSNHVTVDNFFMFKKLSIITFFISIISRINFSLYNGWIWRRYLMIVVDLKAFTVYISRTRKFFKKLYLWKIKKLLISLTWRVFFFFILKYAFHYSFYIKQNSVFSYLFNCDDFLFLFIN